MHGSLLFVVFIIVILLVCTAQMLTFLQILNLHETQLLNCMHTDCFADHNYKEISLFTLGILICLTIIKRDLSFYSWYPNLSHNFAGICLASDVTDQSTFTKTQGTLEVQTKNIDVLYVSLLSILFH